MIDALTTDPRLSSSASFKEDKILLRVFVKLLSKSTNIKLSIDYFYNNEYIFTRFTNQKTSTIMDSIAHLYGTYWEKTQNGYILRQFIHGIEGHLPKDPDDRRRMEALSDFLEKFEETSDNIKSKFNFSDGKNPKMTFSQLPSNLRKDVIDVIEAQKTVQKNKDNPAVQKLYDNVDSLNLGFRVISSNQNPFRRMEFMGFRDNAFFSMSISDVPSQYKIQKSALTSRDPKIHSYRSTQMPSSEKAQFVKKDQLFNQTIDLKASYYTHPKLLSDIYNLTENMNIITFVWNFSMEKRTFNFRDTKISDIFRQMSRLYSDLEWDVTRNGVIVFRVNYIDM